MSSASPLSGWNSTDEEVPVRFGSGNAEPKGNNVVIGGPAHDIRSTERTEKRQVVSRERSNPRMLQLSAVTGVSIVLLGTAFYFGVLGIRGDLGGGTSTETVVTITADGHFDPAEVTVTPGSSLTLKNENRNPQVLKPSGARELFPVQVLFETPYTATIPESANGEYLYISETLPESELLTINVRAMDSGAVNAPAASSTSTETSSIEIPLPFDTETTPQTGGSALHVEPVPAPAPKPSPVVVPAEPAPSPVSVHTDTNSETVIVSITGTETQNSPSPNFDTRNLPSNPYTVDALQKNGGAASVAQHAPLHSGAPLQELSYHTPVRVTETGTGYVWAIFLMAFAGFGLVYQWRVQRG